MYSNAATDYLFTGQEVGGEYVYPTAGQNAVIVFANPDDENFFLSAKDGDFTTDGMAITTMACDTDDITIGNAPAAVLNATLMNPNGLMETLTWGYGSAYIGVEIDSTTADKQSTHPCAVKGGLATFSMDANGTAYRNGSSLGAIGGSPLAIISDYSGADVYFITTTGMGRRKSLVFSVVSTPNDAQKYMAAKYTDTDAPIGIALDANGCPYIFNNVANDTKTTYTYIPMGKYDFSNVDAFGITFTAEAYNEMTLFDADATDWVQSLDFSTPQTISDLITALMTEMGMTANVSASAVNTGVSLSENPITSYSVTYRQVLKWLAEAIGCNARISRTGGVVEFVPYDATPITDSSTPPNALVISCDTIVGNTRTKYRNAVPAINQVVCYNTVGAGFEYHDPNLPVGTPMVPMYVVANPFIDPSSSMQPVEDLCGLVDDIPTYNPTTISVVCSDPRIDAGDFVTVTETDNSNTYVIPVMTQTIYWNGSCRTQYGATGNKVRQIPDAITDSSDLSGVVSSNPAAVVNMIQAHGIDADWITAGTISDRNGNNTWDLDTGDLSITTGKIETTYTHTYYYTDYSASDITRIQQIIAGQITPTETDYEKYDTDGNGYIRVLDMVRIQAMIDNQENLTKTITTTIDPSANNKAIAIRVQIPAIGQAAAVDRYATYAVSQVNVNTATFVDLFASNAHLDEVLIQDDVSGDIELGGGSILFSDTNNNTTVTMTGSSLDYDDGNNNHTVITPTGVTYRDGVASPTERILRRSRASSGTSTVTLEAGVYIAYVTHTNSSTVTETGMYIIQAGTTSSIREVVAAGNQTLSVSGLTLTWTTSNSNRQLRLVYIS